MKRAPTAQGQKSAAPTVLLVMLLLLPMLLPAAAAAPNFPALSGRIVDQANIIPPATAAAIEPKLADLEEKSGIQLVVATVSSLQGEEIEPYANELFRFWQLGEKTKNNGVLLLVAPNEHRVHIEVGYGLEGTLTDALSAVIIANAMTPRFKANDFGGGIERGVDDIITVLTTDSADWQGRPQVRLDSQDNTPSWGVPLLLIAIFVVILFSAVSPGFRSIVFQILLLLLMSSGRGGGGASWGGGSGGGFSGGGGSSGGGGASGGW
jgi:uncharacterized protein